MSGATIRRPRWKMALSLDARDKNWCRVLCIMCEVCCSKNVAGLRAFLGFYSQLSVTRVSGG